MGSPYDILFEPVKIGPVMAPNRFYAVPHATGHGHLQPNGSIALREMKARGGWGTVSMQVTEIAPDSDCANHPMERIWDGSDLDNHRRLVERIKAHGALTAIELGHLGMRSRNLTTGAPVPGPCHLPVIRAEAPVQARAMTKSDIRAFRASHRRAALAALDVGYDIVYVYASHDLSLLSHFLSRRYNHRSDEYGGSLENRVRLLREVLEDTLDAVGGKAAVALRFAVAEPGADRALMHDGEGREVVEMLAELPDLWDVNLSSWPADSATSRFSEEGFQLEYMSFVKQVTSKPVVGVGRYTSPDKMVALVRKGVLDFIGAARPSIADPFLPNKIREGRVEDIRECIGCNICVSHDAYGIPIRCTQNPVISEEWRRNWHPENVPRGDSTNNILVVGAGPAGLECALTLARAGHQITLVDRADTLGGRVNKESGLKGLGAWIRVRDYRAYQLQQMANVSIYLESNMGAASIAEYEADHVVVATGAHWRRDGVGGSSFYPLPIEDGASILIPDDIMDGLVPEGRVVIYDDDHYYMAGVLAEHLVQHGLEVSIHCALPEISSWAAFTLEQPRIIRRLAALGVDWQVNSRLSEVKQGAACFSCSFSEKQKPEVNFDHLLIVGARLPNEQLAEDLAGLIGEEKVSCIGDCLVPGTIQAAIYSGHKLARSINGDDLARDSFHREQAKLYV